MRKNKIAIVLLGTMLMNVLTGCGVGIKKSYPFPEFTGIEHASTYVDTGDYKNLAVSVEKSTPVTDDEANEMVERYVKQMVKPIEKKGRVERNDIVFLKHKGSVDGKNDERLALSDTYLDLSNSAMPNEYNQALLGMKKGEKKDVKIMMPKDDSSDLAGKEITYHITVMSVASPVVVSDTTVKEASDGKYKSISALKDVLVKNETNARLKDYTNRLESAIMDAVLKSGKMKKSAPKDLVQYFIDMRLALLEENAIAQRMTLEEFVKQTQDVSMDELKKQLKKENEELILTELCMYSIGQKEGIKLSEKDLQKGLDKYVKIYGFKNQKEMFKIYPKSYLEDSLYIKAVLDYLKDTVQVIDVVKQPVH